MHTAPHRRTATLEHEPLEMLAEGLTSLCEALVLEGAAVMHLDEPSPPELVQESGAGGPDILADAALLLRRDALQPSYMVGESRRPVLVMPWAWWTGYAALVMWRPPGGRAWGAGDLMTARAAGGLVRAMVELGPGEVSLDRLTHLPNRAYFIEEVDRHIDRLDLDNLVGSLLLIDVDGMARLNTRHGRATGDQLLLRLSHLLRAMVRPTDIVGRVGGDEFAVWMDGMDHMTAAERADSLAQRRFVVGEENDPAASQLSLSIGIASRQVGNGEGARTLLRRAHAALHEVKAAGGGGWRVSRPPGPSES
jgi:diguanylate cyclase (GGDEF)-like protein